MGNFFCETFSFSSDNVVLKNILGKLKRFFFQKHRESSIRWFVWHIGSQRNLISLYIVGRLQKREEKEDDPKKLNLSETEGKHIAQDTNTDHIAQEYLQPLKMKKNNIGKEVQLKMAVLGDYWYKETMTQVVNLLKKYEDAFPRSFSEMKVIT